MMKRMSGRVSGLLDDLSETMTLLHDLMPSRNSELVRARLLPRERAAREEGCPDLPARRPVTMQRSPKPAATLWLLVFCLDACVAGSLEQPQCTGWCHGCAEERAAAC